MDITIKNCTPEELKAIKELLNPESIMFSDDGVKRVGEKIGSLGLPRKPMHEIMDNLRKSMKGSTITAEEWLSYRHEK